MVDNFNQDLNQATSDSDVQEIELPICVCSTRRKRRGRLLREPIDRRFCRCSPRKKRVSEDNTNNSQLAPSQDKAIDRPGSGFTSIAHDTRTAGETREQSMGVAYDASDNAHRTHVRHMVGSPASVRREVTLPRPDQRVSTPVLAVGASGRRPSGAAVAHRRGGSQLAPAHRGRFRKVEAGEVHRQERGD
jgi:hypothetical protein